MYVGHAAVFQLHRLSILKGKRFCNESNARLSLERSAREGSLGGGCWAPLHDTGEARGALTLLHHHLVNVRGGAVLELDHLPFEQLLSCGGENGQKWARP